MKFERGKTIEPLKRIGDSKKTGTTVRFLADDQIFETLEYQYEILENRFREMAFLTKGLRITLTDNREETPKKADFHFEGGLNSFVEYLNKYLNDKKHPSYKNDFAIYTQRAFAMQRAKQHGNDFVNDFVYSSQLPSLQDCGMENKLPPELDFNYLQQIKKQNIIKLTV